MSEEEEEEVEEFFVVKANERTDMRIGNRHVPYRTHKVATQGGEMVEQAQRRPLSH